MFTEVEGEAYVRPMLTLRVEAPHFVAGAEVRFGFVGNAAPILKYMRGWDIARVRNYCSTKGWRCELLYPS